MSKFPLLYEGRGAGSALSIPDLRRHLTRRDRQAVETEVSIIIRQGITQAAQNEMDARVNEHLQEHQKQQLIARQKRRMEILVANAQNSLVAAGKVHRATQDFICRHPELEPVAREIEAAAMGWLIGADAVDP